MTRQNKTYVRQSKGEQNGVQVEMQGEKYGDVAVTLLVTWANRKIEIIQQRQTSIRTTDKQVHVFQSFQPQVQI